MSHAHLSAKFETVETAPGFRRMFRPGRLTIGVFFPVEACGCAEPALREQERLARRAEALGFAALWCRDTPAAEQPLADGGQVLDSWVYLAWLAAQTRTIALASGSPLRQALHVARTAASIDRLSGGRLVLGLAAADRPIGVAAAFGPDVERRAGWFRERFEIVRHALCREGMVPNATACGRDAQDAAARLPMLVTGHIGQPLRWIADRADGWISYPRGIDRQAATVARWQGEVYAVAPGRFKPFAQSLCVDLDPRPPLAPTPIHLGFKAGRHFLLRFLESLRLVGVNHVILNLEHGTRPAGDVLEEIGSEVLPWLGLAQGTAASSVAPEPSEAAFAEESRR